jgi:hypothetical protein
MRSSQGLVSPIASLTLRTWTRHVLPLTLMAVVTMLIVLWLGLHERVAADVRAAQAQLFLGWKLAAVAWIFQLWLVGAAAPLVRGVAAGEPLSQGRSFAFGATGLVRAAVPCLVAVIAIMLGGLALVVPGVFLLVLVSMTGASEALGTGAIPPITDSIATARKHLATIAIVVAIVLALDFAIALVAQLATAQTLPKKPNLAALTSARTYVRVVAIALVAFSPLPACAIAAVYQRQR